MALGDLGDARMVCHLAHHVDGDDGLGAASLALQSGEGFLQQLRVDVAGLVTVDEGGLCAGVGDGVGGGGERQGGGEHHVAGPHAQREQAQVQGGGARRERYGVLHAGVARQLSLEGVDFGPQRGDPPGAHGSDQRIFLGLGHIWRRQ